MSKEKKGAPAGTGAGPRLKKNGKPRMARKKFWTIVGVVVVVICIAGGGMYKWHEQPSFCSTFCHIEQAYVENYAQEQGVAGTDKYGNAVSNTNAMMSVLHRKTNASAKPEIVCVDCHVPNYVELAHDGVNFVSGNYRVPRDERSGADLQKWDGKDSESFCANERCHSYLLGSDGALDREKLEHATAKLEFNPHSMHHGEEIQCTTCHKGHRASTLACTGCHEHENVKVPDGWLTWQQSNELMQNSHVAYKTSE